MASALLSFKLGPVQPFIETARTLRDLWTGSYMLSWLVAAAMKPLIESGVAAFITPYVDSGTNPLLRTMTTGPTGDPQATLPCLPHTFAAQVPTNRAEEFKQACIAACAEEWKTITEKVRAAVRVDFARGNQAWDRNWDAQVDHYFELTCVARPMDAGSPDAEDWVSAEWNQLAGLLESARSVRHVPNYSAVDDNGKFPMKCSLLGTFEQMGPAEHGQSNNFWKAVSGRRLSNLPATRLRPNDKLCAISLVKRFAWPAYFAQRLGLKVRDRRYSDTATQAAKKWLADGTPLDPEQLREDDGAWNGQWLHWTSNDQGKTDGEPERPQRVADLIRHKAEAEKSRPPTYYALLHMDGDNMGDFFQGEKGKAFGEGAARFQRITRRLTTFSLQTVREIVEVHLGELIYAGGDDILAFLPTETAIQCARRLREAFREAECLGESAAITGGIAVVHYKEDLRFAVETVRRTEKVAKRIGEHGDHTQKNALALAVCRRSGEHTTVVMGWSQTELLQQLVNDFKGSALQRGASDRWAYKLRTELPTLSGLPLAAGKAEAMRLVGRVENAPAGFEGRIRLFLESYINELSHPDRNWPAEQILEGFVTLCQSASFLARGRD